MLECFHAIYYVVFSFHHRLATTLLPNECSPHKAGHIAHALEVLCGLLGRRTLGAGAVTSTEMMNAMLGHAIKGDLKDLSDLEVDLSDRDITVYDVQTALASIVLSCTSEN